jgi:hypothetical protein
MEYKNLKTILEDLSTGLVLSTSGTDGKQNLFDSFQICQKESNFARIIYVVPFCKFDFSFKHLQNHTSM